MSISFKRLNDNYKELQEQVEAQRRAIFALAIEVNKLKQQQLPSVSEPQTTAATNATIA